MTTSRRDFLRHTAQLGAAIGLAPAALAACGGDEASTATAGPIADGLEPEAGPLRIVNYADYINPDVIADFEAQYGVTVEVSTITTDTESVTKLASGALKVDLNHSMSTTSVGNLIKGGLLQPLNKSYIPNLANVVAAYADPWYDEGGAYTVPYTYFGTGIGYRSDRIDPAQVEEWGWDTLWNATAFKGQVSVLDDEREALVMAMLRRGLTDVNTGDKATIDTALADLLELIDLVNVKVNIEGYKDIPEGTTTVAHTWSADMITGAAGYMPEGTDPSVLGFWHPPAGSYLVSNDSMGVMANAEHPVLAHLWINHITDNAVAEKNFSWVGYLPVITRLDADYVIGAGLVPENLRNCVPTADEIAKGLFLRPLDPDTTALYEQAWSTFRAG